MTKIEYFEWAAYFTFILGFVSCLIISHKSTYNGIENLPGLLIAGAVTSFVTVMLTIILLYVRSSNNRPETEVIRDGYGLFEGGIVIIFIPILLGVLLLVYIFIYLSGAAIASLIFNRW